MPKHFLSDAEMVVESEESGKFYPKVLTGKPGLIPREDPQGWTFCREGIAEKIVSFLTLEEAEDYLRNRHTGRETRCSACGTSLMKDMSYRTMPRILCNDCIEENPALLREE